ncbi:unnamed protein product, partial [Brassica oleracea var. botrytis]
DSPFTAFVSIYHYKKAGHCTSAVEVRLLRFWEEARYGKRRANGGLTCSSSTLR